MNNEEIISQELESHGYINKRKILSGAYGTIYKVYSLKYKMNFAAKISKNHIEEEIECLCRLTHPNIVAPYQTFEGSGMFFIIMEYCKTSLKQTIMRNGALDQKTFLKFSSQLIDALDYCLKHDILHCNIKAENVLIDKYGRIKLCDFGLAKIRKQEEKTEEARCLKGGNVFCEEEVICGTLDYLAPELLMKKTSNTEKSEVWSLGILFYECLAGHLPWTSTTNKAMQVMMGIVKIEKLNTSSEIMALLKKMLQTNPKFRISVESLKAEMSHLAKNVGHVSFCKRKDHIKTFHLQNSFSMITNHHRRLSLFNVHYKN
jgi:serine/threonine protein kinase